MEGTSMYDDPLSVCCAFEPIIFDTTANELFSVPDKGSEATGSFQHIPMNNSFSSIALPDIYTCKEVITPCMMESSVRGGDHIDSVKSAPCPSVSAPDSCGTNSMESSLSDEEVELSARTRRSIKHSISEKRRVIRFNTCIDEFMSMLNDNGVSVRKNKLRVLEETVRTMREIQSQVNDLKKKIRASKLTKDHLSIEIPAPDQQEYYGIFQDIAVPSVIVSLSGIILDVNKSFRGALAKTRASLVGRSIFSVAHSSSLPLLYNSFSSLLALSPPAEIKSVELFWSRGQLQPHSICVSLHPSPSADAPVFFISFTPLVHQGEQCTVVPVINEESAVDGFQVSSGKNYCLLEQESILSACFCATPSDACASGFKYNLESP
ncbi:hypothetical protein WA588_006277, partial [Blastocystis sp. NMH]